MVSVPLSRVWVHCPRASNGLLPRRSNLVGYVRWGARSDQFPPCQTIISTALQVAIRVADHPPGISVSLQVEHKQFIGNGHLIGSSLLRLDMQSDGSPHFIRVPQERPMYHS